MSLFPRLRAALLVGFLTGIGVAAGSGNAQAANPFTYALTVNSDPVQPGQVVEFDLTLTNTSSSTRGTTLYYTVPTDTYGDNGNGGGYYNPGTSVGVNFGSIAAGTSVTRPVHIELLTTTPAPDGTPITLNFVDETNGASLSRTVTAHNAPVLNLQLSTDQATVARGGSFAYTLSYRSANAVSNAVISVPVPANATFVSADDGGTLGSDGVVRWSLGALTSSASGQVHLTLAASTAASAIGPILVEANLSDAVGDVAHASATTLISTFPTFTYALTASQDPVQPGQVVTYNLTVTNMSSSGQNATLYYTVPTDTYGDNGNGAGYYNPGTSVGVNFGSIAAGTSVTRPVHIELLTTTPAPDGTPITLNFVDETNGASLSRTVVAHNAPVLNLQLASTQATVAAGSSCAYTLAYRTANAVSGALLRVPVPTNATFVSADGGGVLGSDGTVQWSLGSLPTGASGQVHLTLAASTAASAVGPILVEADLADAVGDEARASATTLINTFPTFTYALTASSDPVQLGQVVEFDLTVTNTTSSTRVATLYYTVPTDTNGDNGAGNGYYNPGTSVGVNFGSMAGGTSVTRPVRIQLLTATPLPDGTPITLTFVDETNGASLSRIVTVRVIPQVGGATMASATQGQPFSYQIAATNYPASYGASNLPAGLSINPNTGLISGTPTVAGNFSVGLTATNPAGTGTGALALAVNAAPPAITSSTTASGVQGQPFSYQIAATYSPASYGASGLPPGLTLNTSSGLISGTPSQTGTFSVNLSATNAGGVGSATLTLTIAPAPVGVPVITSALSASAQVGQGFFYGIAASNSPTSYAATGLPAGLGLDPATGLISGTPSQSGTFSIGLSAANAAGAGTATLTLTIAAAPTGAPVITSALSASTQVGQSFSYQIVATNSPINYLAAPLPGGLQVNATGLISGTALQTGTFSVSLDAFNSVGLGSATLTLTVAPAPVVTPVITSPLAVTAQLGQPFSYQIVATNSPTHYYITTGLPGLSIDPATGLISGTPTYAGTFRTILNAATSTGTGTATLVLTVTSALPVATLTATVPSVMAGTGDLAELTLTLSTAQATDTVVNFTIKGTAVNGTDYVLLKGTKKIKAGKTSKSIKIQPLGDGGGPGVKRTVVFTLQPGADYAVGTTGKVKVKILGQ